MWIDIIGYIESCYGDYCIKATVEMTGREEKDGATSST
jgi:hypothetical protein